MSRQSHDPVSVTDDPVIVVHTAAQATAALKAAARAGRPIVLANGQAALGRPPETVLKIL